MLIQAGLAFLLVDVAESVDPVATEAGVDVAQLIFGVLFAVLAVVTWRKRDSKGGALLARVGSTGVAGSLGLGLAQGS
ncbi:hypothetical protein G7085_03430 [Tessaracoccus sp. HDW20]|uniref:hypothetical protein n=1 Tax=Tessaracoccus coleopterorum TaxID=2714950 RepID=UPI0018D372F6|nr:hypothetical protein [Tessaracoccus coleopterorum]NHB84028.1 hypothetical protein [Tessaracoccus coleopterorum]